MLDVAFGFFDRGIQNPGYEKDQRKKAIQALFSVR